MIGTIVFCRLTQKGPCGMTVNNDIDDDSATKHGDSHMNFFWRTCQRVRVSIEGEVVLTNVHSGIWVGVSHLVFNGGDSSVHCQGEDEARHGAALGKTPFHGVGDDITVVELARELVLRFEEDGAPFPKVFV